MKCRGRSLFYCPLVVFILPICPMQLSRTKERFKNHLSKSQKHFATLTSDFFHRS